MSDSPQRRSRTESQENADLSQETSRSYRDHGRSGSLDREPRKRTEKLRSPSPRRENRHKRKDGGFKWKEKRRNEDDRPRDREEGLKRGYRDHYRPRSRSRSPHRRDDMRHDEWERGRERGPREKRSVRPEKDRKPEKEKAAPPISVPAAQQQPMIVVTVNDRLGTKKQIPCFPSDTVKDFKIIVASMIGRQPHEILLKRQGERPFKDILTLQDYGVSNNVQLDLEVDTGD